MKFIAVASIVEPDQISQNMKKVWPTVEKMRMANGTPEMGIPHFSWHVAEEYKTAEAKGILSQMASMLFPISTSSSGLGVFTGPTPVLYLPVVKTKQMLELHREIWNALLPLATRASALYSPEEWMPHITLVYAEAVPDQVHQFVRSLIEEPLRMNFRFDHFAMIYREEQDHGLLFSVPFRVTP